MLGEIEGKGISSVPELCELLLPMKTAFPSVCKLYAGALAFGASTAVCEASFSVLTKLITKNAIDESGQEGRPSNSGFFARVVRNVCIWTNSCTDSLATNNVYNCTNSV